METIDLLFQLVEKIPGVGPKTEEALHRLNIFNLKDLFFHIPRFINQKHDFDAKNFNEESLYVFHLKIIKLPEKNFNTKNYEIEAIYNDHLKVKIKFFNYFPYHIVNKIAINDYAYFVGKAKIFRDQLQIIHPEFYTESQNLLINYHSPIYNLTFGINSQIIHNIINKAFVQINEIEEWHAKSLVKKYNLPSFYEAIENVHCLKKYNENDYKISLFRLALDELFSYQLMLKLTRMKDSQNNKQPIKIDYNLLSELKSILPFTLTDSQKKVLKDIFEDIESNKIMWRLIQGDVGSGKTIIGIFAILATIGNGGQAVLMAPTEILALQHFENIKLLINKLKIKSLKTILLKSKMPVKEKRANIENCSNGEANIIIGTHALIQPDINFQNLKIAIIDEQHRFGVMQRMALVEKGNNVNILFMTATPIPRTLTMAQYGDIDVSIIENKPLGRLPITTTIISKDKIYKIIESVKKYLSLGQKLYWICPLIENDEEKPKSEDNSKQTAIERFDFLNKYFPGDVGLVHGKLSQDEKNEVMENFTFGNLKILVATTVVEVGVDVKEATFIVIEDAEFFGLSQLHQLRGRVGRNDIQSYCILVHGPKISSTARERLKIMCNSNDGFLIAEKDLELRGTGEILGTKQSGDIHFSIAEFPRDNKLIKVASEEVEIILENYKETGQISNKIFNLLKLFNFSDIIKLYKH